MKKIFITIAILTFMAIFAGTAFAITGTVNTQNLNLRDKPSTSNSNVITQLSKSATVNILEELDEWYKVSYENNEGYVSKQYLTVNSDSDTGVVNPNPDDNSQGTINEDEQEKVLSDAVVYSLPLINATKVYNLSANSEVTVISEVGNWKYILTNEISGWILASKMESNITETKPEENNEQQSEYPKTMYVNASELNVREQASTSSDVITSVGKNDEINVTGESGDWYSIEINGNKGYVKKDYLSDSKN